MSDILADGAIQFCNRTLFAKKYTLDTPFVLRFCMR